MSSRKLTVPDNGLFGNNHLASELLTIRELAPLINTSAFVGINPTDDPITSGLRVNREQSDC
jgi:hypothetical protein